MAERIFLPFTPYVLGPEIVSGLENGRYLSGTFQRSERGVDTVRAYNESESRILSVNIQSHQARNRATHGDKVVVEPSGNRNEIQFEGSIVAVLSRTWDKAFAGFLDPSLKSHDQQYVVLLNDRRMPKVQVCNDQKLVRGTWYAVKVDEWNEDCYCPKGHVVETLGEVGTFSAENNVVLCSVPAVSFSPDLFDSLTEIPADFIVNEAEKRRDFRSDVVISVDPPYCLDVDDAISCVKLDNGNYQLTVHIADVSAFVRPGSLVDKEAALRGTSVYLIDKQINMLPELLSTNLCSLLPGTDRLTMSCVSEITPSADIVSAEFVSGVIHSRAALSYGAAQKMVNDVSDTSDVAVTLRRLQELGVILKARRLEQGALSFSTPEVMFSLDKQTSLPSSISVKPALLMHSTIEEMMLLANREAAKLIVQKFPESATVRVHPPMSTERLGDLQALARHANIALDTSSSKAVGKSLAKAPSELRAAMFAVAARSLNSSLYCCSGFYSPTELVHSGLNFPEYTNFTSPIRRYADVVVHRLLKSAIGSEPLDASVLNKESVEELCRHLTDTERNANTAERLSRMLFLQMYAKNHEVEEKAVITKFVGNTIEVHVTRLGVAGKVFLDAKNCKVLDVDGTQQTISEATKKITDWNVVSALKIGDTVLHVLDLVVVTLNVFQVNPRARWFNCRLTSPQIAGMSDAKRKRSEGDNAQPSNSKRAKTPSASGASRDVVSP